MRGVRVVLLVALLGAACVGDDEGSAPSKTHSTTAPSQIPDEETAADVGCLDEPGTLEGDAIDWYPDDAQGRLSLSGEPADSGDLDAFVTSASAAIAATLGPMQVTHIAQQSATDACPTHRFAVFGGEEEPQLVVAAWRVESAAAPWWVASQGDFVAYDDHAVVSDGESIRVALVVAPDGTTARVTAYGVGARASVAGWPTTTVSRTPIELGPAPASIDELVEIGRAVLAGVLADR